MPARAGSCHGAVSAAKTRAAMLLQRDIYSNWVGRFLGRSSRRLRAVEEAGYTGDKQRRARVDRCHAIETGYSTRVGRPHEEQQTAQLDALGGQQRKLVHLKGTQSEVTRAICGARKAALHHNPR